MKSLTLAFLAFTLSYTGASATTTVFDPDFSNQTGYTSNTSGGGSITTSGDTMTDSDFSVNGETAYVSGTTGPQHNINKISTTLVFTPNFTYDATDNNNGASQVTLFQIRDPQNANGSLLSVDLFVSKYLGRDELDLSSNFQFGGGVQTGAGMQSYTTTPAYGSINKLSGDTLTLKDTETFDFSNEDANFGGVVISNYGTLSDSTGLLYTYNFAYTSRDNTVSSDIDGSNFNPPDDNLTFNAGIVAAGVNPDFLQPGASVVFSEVNVSVPEPSTYAFLGLGALALLFVGRRAQLKA